MFIYAEADGFDNLPDEYKERWYQQAVDLDRTDRELDLLALRREQLALLVWYANINIDHFNEQPPESAEDHQALAHCIVLRDRCVVLYFMHRLGGRSEDCPGVEWTGRRDG